jgi:hypothetical protein
MNILTYELLGGGSIQGSTPTELIQDMRNGSFNGGDSLEAYIEETAAACKLQNRSIIRINSHKNFIDDLITNKFLVLKQA